MARKEWERVCKRCDTVWYVSLAAAKEKKPNAMLRGGIRMQAAGGQASFGSWSKSGAAGQLHQMEAKIARIQSTNSCPGCGSGSFTQRKVKM